MSHLNVLLKKMGLYHQIKINKIKFHMMLIISPLEELLFRLHSVQEHPLPNKWSDCSPIKVIVFLFIVPHLLKIRWWI